MVLLHVALNWLWYCYSVFSWFLLMLPWIDCDIVFFCVFMVHRHDAFDFFWHCLFLFSWFFLLLHWIDCDIGYLCSYGSSLCCIGLIVTLFICVPIGLPHVALDWFWHCLSVFSWFFLMLHWIDCDIVYQCSHCSSSCRIGLIVALFICVLMVLPHVALDWLWHCLSLFSWFLLMLHWIDSDIVYLCFYGSSSCCMGLIVTLLICVLVPPPHVVFDWLWYCLSLFLWFFLMLHWIDCGIVYLYCHWSSSCSIVLIVTVLICVLLFLPFLHWIDCDIVYLCSYGSSSCCISLIVTLFVFVLVVLPHVALDWLWHC